MSTFKRAIAGVGGLIALGVVLAVLGALSFTIRQTGGGADPDAAFSSTDVDDLALRAETAWDDDPPGLVRTLDPTTRDELATAWLRADQAVALAAEGDRSGLGVWYTGPALEQVDRRFARDGSSMTSTADEVSTLEASGHRLRVDFVSADAQIVAMWIETETISGETRAVETIMVLSDGSWRIRHLEAR